MKVLPSRARFQINLDISLLVHSGTIDRTMDSTSVRLKWRQCSLRAPYEGSIARQQHPKSHLGGEIEEPPEVPQGQ